MKETGLCFSKLLTYSCTAQINLPQIFTREKNDMPQKHLQCKVSRHLRHIFFVKSKQWCKRRFDIFNKRWNLFRAFRDEN